MIRKNFKLLMLSAVVLTFSLSTPSFALHPEMQIPDSVEMKHEACQTMSAIARKYAVSGVFPKAFEEGTQCLNRVELAAALELMTERLAEKVVREGALSVAREDLEKLADIREELRAEMLLVGTRTFQQRNESLGTMLHPLTKNISLSGQMTGVFQSSAGLTPRDHSAVVGRGNLVFNFKIGDNTTAVIDLEAIGGDGLDPEILSFSGLNGVAGATGDRVRFRQAWVEHSFLNDNMLFTIGKIDLGNYFDSNTVANDETSQFLSGAFVNAHALSLPDKGPGARVQFALTDSLILSIGYGSGNVDEDGIPTGRDILNHGFGIAEIDYKITLGELEGNYRIYGALDGALPDNSLKLRQKNAYNYGVSIDQQLTDKLTIFGRYAQRESGVYLTNRSWTAGLQYTGLIPNRAEDVTAVAYGQIYGQGLEAQEKVLEWYYKIRANQKIAVSPIVQYLINPEGNRSRENVIVLGLRSQVLF